jgi:hypothetical protein
MTGERVESVQHGVEARLDMTFAAAQRGELERDQRVLKFPQIVAAQRQVLQQVARARIPIRVAPLNPGMPALRDLEQFLADGRKPLHQRRLLMIANCPLTPRKVLVAIAPGYALAARRSSHPVPLNSSRSSLSGLEPRVLRHHRLQTDRKRNRTTRS